MAAYIRQTADVPYTSSLYAESMTRPILTTLAQATPERLTTLLHESGALPIGQVSSVEQQPNTAFNSSIAHLTLTYSPDTPPDAPGALLLKLNADGWGEYEVAFYQLALEQTRPVPSLVRCYATAFDEVSGASHLLLEDLSVTHRIPLERETTLRGDSVPSERVCQDAVDALAAFHAYWWQHPALGTRKAGTMRPWYGNFEQHAAHVRRREGEWAQFREHFAGALEPDLVRQLEGALAALPYLFSAYLEQRVSTLEHLTLTNGDAYFNQFLCTLEPGSHAYIVDFQEASANLSTFDLVHLLATFWTSAQRHEGGRERLLLERYLGGLERGGVRGYGKADLERDYRLMLSYILLVPVWDATTGAAESYWRPKLRCLSEAHRDWNCVGLLEL